jgi:hypothetical protein
MNPILKRGSLKHLWQFSVRGTIWRIATDGLSHIVGEERDAQKKRTSFFCLECESGKVCWSGRRLGDDWWIGIEACVDGVLYLHGFATPELPVHRGITAVDVRSGALLWTDDDIMFLAASGNTLHAVRRGIAGSQIEEMDSRSGEVRQTFEASDRLVHSIRNAEAGSSGQLTFPGPPPEGDAGEDGIMRRLRERPGAEMMGYIDHPVTPVITSSIDRGTEPRTSAVRDWVLEILDRRTGAVLFTETLSQGTHWPAQETVFVLQNRLFYVKDSTSLVAVLLGGTET